MTYAAPTDFYDDGLVHSHDWSRNTPPGVHHAERHQSNGHEHDELSVEHRRVRN